MTEQVFQAYGDDEFYEEERIRVDVVIFRRDLAEQVDKELRAALPTNQWSDGYIVDVIELCCKGETYFYGHHGAFDAYLDKFGFSRDDDDIYRPLYTPADEG